jgi:hypothetical protein
MARALLVWLPVVVTAAVVIVLIFTAAQQNLRMGANDPQVQMAEDAAARLDAGASPSAVIPTQPTDIARSLAPFLIVFDHDGRPLASSATLNGQTPTPPGGVFGTVPSSGRHEITWAPRPDVREAAVIVAYRNGFVLAGRSLRLVEEREDALGQVTLILFTVMLVLSGLAALLASWTTMRTTRGPLVARKPAAQR